jgi:hypothetical protein
MVFTFPLTKRGDFAVFFCSWVNSFYHSTNFTTNISTNVTNVGFPLAGIRVQFLDTFKPIEPLFPCEEEEEEDLFRIQ